MLLPWNLKKGQTILGLAGYDRRFVLRFADISRPLTSLTRKDILFECTKTCHDTFQLLKKYLTEKTILKYPNQETLTPYLQMQVNMLGLVF